MDQTELVSAVFFARAVRDAVPEGGTFSFRVKGASMGPVIRDGDLVHVRRAAADEAAAGDIVVVETGEFLRAHRLVKKVSRETERLATQGDTLLYLDEPVHPDNLLGVVETVEKPDGKKLCLRTWRSRVAARFFLAAGTAGRFLASAIGPRAIETVHAGGSNTARRVLRSAYHLFSGIPYRIMSKE